MGEKNLTEEVDQLDQQIPVEQDQGTFGLPGKAQKIGRVVVASHMYQNEDIHQTEAPTTSVSANTHRKRRITGHNRPQGKVRRRSIFSRILPVSAGVLAVLAIVVAGLLGQYYKTKAMPNVFVAGENVGAKNKQQIKSLLDARQDSYKISFQTSDKQLSPDLETIGFSFDQKKTIDDIFTAKRDSGIVTKLQFWKRHDVPVSVTINNNLLTQYIDTNFPEITTAATDATLNFDPKTNQFNITEQADGKGADLIQLKADIVTSAMSIKSAKLEIKPSPRGPNITEDELKPLLVKASEHIKRRVILSGQGYSFVARPVDIAGWLTPTPQEDGSVLLVVDAAKVQSYVEGIGKRIASAPQDKKIIVDASSGQEVVLQEGRDGTELADRQVLANSVANSVASNKDVTLPMNIQVASFKTVNMNAFEKWIEVDLSEQRTTAYERATPVKSFIIASGTRGYETVKGEFAIWLRVRSQTMQGGSRADGDYYSIPNVEWVSYFYKDYALHGAWWREKFGYPASHGCVNMRNEDAKWVYEWAPLGTKVIVHD